MSSYKSLILAGLLYLGVTEASTIERRGFTFDASCDQGKQDVITKEIEQAKFLVDFTRSDVQSGIYYETFFPEDRVKDPAWAVEVTGIFERIYNMLDPKKNDYDFSITCDSSTEMCDKLGMFAHMSDKLKRMNFCNKFFAPDRPKEVRTTEDVVKDCDTLTLREVQWSLSAIIVHECTHTDYVMGGPGKKALDYAYGFNGCFLLPQDKFDRSCVKYARPGKVLCQDPNDSTKETICPRDFATKNSDTFSFIAAGVGYSTMCARIIPLPAAPAPAAATNATGTEAPAAGETPVSGPVYFSRKRGLRLFKRDCDPGDDAILFDDGPEE